MRPMTFSGGKRIPRSRMEEIVSPSTNSMAR